MGCPETLTIESCYNKAQIGMFEGNLGFELIKIIENSPHIGNFVINDQSSEEAFTVYDHPKVFIFQKTDDFNIENVAKIFNEIDLSNVEHLTPLQATKTGLNPQQAADRPNLMLSEENQKAQKESGTWSELFNSQSLINRVEIVGVIVWYLVIWLLGLTTYPLLRFFIQRVTR